MDVKNAIQERRAYRSLDPIEITDDLIKDFAESAKLAPSCGNKQPWRFVFVQDKTQLDLIFKALSPTNGWAKKASMIIGVISKPKNDCMIGERIYYLFDTGMATGLILLRATELGLVAHPIAGYDESKVKKILEIPEEMRLITLLIVGKHSKEISSILSENMKLGEQQRPPRISLEKFVFLNRYNNKIVE